jgi:hypothetical protein
MWLRSQKTFSHFTACRLDFLTFFCYNSIIKKIEKGSQIERKNMSDYLDYMDEIYEEIVSEFGHEVESECIHK